MNKIFFLLSAFFLTTSFADDFSICMQATKNTLDMQQCIDKTSKLQEVELNRLYSQLINLSQDSVNFSVDNLKNAQKVWLNFRDLNCSIYNQGTIASVLNGKCRIQVTKFRINELMNVCKGLGDTPLCK